jgi:hypothetical protein
MLFFTHYSCAISQYCLLSINDYHLLPSLTRKQFIIDPNISSLKTNLEYPNITQLHALAQSKLPSNQYITIDYPSDMNPQYADLFLDKTNQNNRKYANNPQYICAVQFPIRKYVEIQGSLFSKPDLADFKAFEQSYNELAPIFENKQKIVGIGNCCRIRGKNEFTNKLMSFLRTRILEGKLWWVHFYGLNLTMIKRYIPSLSINNVILSCDSTKWTRPHNKALKNEWRGSCFEECRSQFFESYMVSIQKAKINVEY